MYLQLTPVIQNHAAHVKQINFLTSIWNLNRNYKQQKRNKEN